MHETTHIYADIKPPIYPIDRINRTVGYALSGSVPEYQYRLPDAGVSDTEALPPFILIHRWLKITTDPTVAKALAC